MEESIDQTKQEELKAWIKKQLDDAVQKLMKQGDVEGLLVEAKPAWVLPFQILIGKIRPQGQTRGFQWCICGEVPTDFLQSSIAITPRDALRHFSMKWQLEAARHHDKVTQGLSGPESESVREVGGVQLSEMAEALYELVDDARLWLQEGGVTNAKS